MARTPDKRAGAVPARTRPVPRSASRRKRERRRQEAIRSLNPRAAGRRRRWLWGGASAAVIAVAVLLIVLLSRSTPAPQTSNATHTPAVTPLPNLLAAPGNLTGAAVDGVQCQAMEQVAYHIHAHLALFVNGASRVVPPGIGVAPPVRQVQTDAGPYVEGGSCFYWLHTHTGDGIIHVESPTTRTYTLGQFFAIWGQPLSSTQVGPASGTEFVYVDGKPFTGDPSTITLAAHERIQIDVGTNVAPLPFTFPPGL